MSLKGIVLLVAILCLFSACMSSQIGNFKPEIEQVYKTKLIAESGDYQLIKVLAPNKFDKLLIIRGSEVVSEFKSRDLERALESFDLISK